jgi:hypothetical protein
MATDVSSLSLADLERLLKERQAHLDTLLKNRDELQAGIARLDAQMQALLEFRGKGRSLSRPRASNETPLRDVVISVLGKKKKGLSLQDLAEQVLATGYQSNSRNFANVVYQCVYHHPDIVHDDATGLYRLDK